MTAHHKTALAVAFISAFMSRETLIFAEPAKWNLETVAKAMASRSQMVQRLETTLEVIRKDRSGRIQSHHIYTMTLEDLQASRARITTTQLYPVGAQERPLISVDVWNGQWWWSSIWSPTEYVEDIWNVVSKRIDALGEPAQLSLWQQERQRYSSIIKEALGLDLVDAKAILAAQNVEQFIHESAKA